MRQSLGQRAQRHFRGLARRHRWGVAGKAREVFFQHRANLGSDFGQLRLERTLVSASRKALAPLGISAAAELPKRTPIRQNLSRNVERRRGPAKILSGGGDLLRSQWITMDRAGTLLVGGTLADDRSARDQRG